MGRLHTFQENNTLHLFSKHTCPGVPKIFSSLSGEMGFADNYKM